MRKIVCGAWVLGLLSCAGMFPARAQTVSDPNAIRSCLCEEQFVLGLQDSVNQHRQVLESSQKSQASLANQVDTKRAQINVYDNAEVDAFKQLLRKRDEAIAATEAATQNYDDTANRYNQSVASYNSHCAGRTYDENVLHRVQATLACPRP
jgi:restriction endonuclease